MNHIVIPPTLSGQLSAIPVAFVDEQGRCLGHFVPQVADDPACPYGDQELDAMRGETGGRPLAEVGKSLGGK